MKITTPKTAFRFFKTRLCSEVEEFWAAALNADKKVTAAACLFRGTVDQCPFHPRDVFRFAVLHNASSLVVAHNHPSGSVRPSAEDIALTKRLLTSAELMQIPIVDHLILGKGSRYFSFLEERKLTGPFGREYREPS